MDDIDETVLEENLIEQPTKNEYIDKITLELLLNKNHYSKYLSKTDPKKFDEFREHKAKLRKYSVDIVDITSQLIENPKAPFSSDIEESFDSFVKSIFRYIELKKMQNANENEEDDMLFGTVEETSEQAPDADETTPLQSSSVWSKEKVVKKHTISNIDMMMFGKIRR